MSDDLVFTLCQFRQGEVDDWLHVFSCLMLIVSEVEIRAAQS